MYHHPSPGQSYTFQTWIFYCMLPAATVQVHGIAQTLPPVLGIKEGPQPYVQGFTVLPPCLLLASAALRDHRSSYTLTFANTLI